MNLESIKIKGRQLTGGTFMEHIVEPTSKEQAEKISPTDFAYINDALVTIYDSILRVEEKELKRSTFKDVSAKEVHIIHTISLHEHKTTSMIAKELHISKGTLTTNLDHLERKGYIQRMRNQKDRRVINIGLTHKGAVLYRAHDKFHRMLTKAFLNGFDESQIQTIKQSLQNLETFLNVYASEK